MSVLKGQKIVVGITGSIAAYKSATLVRLLIKAGCDVKVVMTQPASLFISPLTLSTLSKHEVTIELFDDKGWHNHVELGLWADMMIIAPASANTLAKAAHGICDNMLMACYLSAKCPVFWCPAMDLDMYLHPSTTNNLRLLKSYGNEILEPNSGELASGLVGQGRMQEPEEIITFLERKLSLTRDLIGKKVVITAGPTYEALDPVRFIGNHSSGKMGISLAKAAAQRGADVTLILGPSNQENPSSTSINTVRVTSGKEMYEAMKVKHNEADICIFAAAVADYKSKNIAQEKIKKSDDTFELVLEKNVDIAFEMGKMKQKGQIHIGFALETENIEVNGQKKLEKKNFDFIVLNSPKDKGAGFQHDTNKIKILDRSGIHVFDLKHKDDVAQDILNHLPHIPI